MYGLETLFLYIPITSQSLTPKKGKKKKKKKKKGLTYFMYKGSCDFKLFNVCTLGDV